MTNKKRIMKTPNLKIEIHQDEDKPDLRIRVYQKDIDTSRYTYGMEDLDVEPGDELFDTKDFYVCKVRAYVHGTIVLSLDGEMGDTTPPYDALVYVDKSDIHPGEEPRAVLNDELYIWNSYIEGDLLMYVITDEDSGDVVACSGGYYDTEGANGAAEEEVKRLLKELKTTDQKVYEALNKHVHFDRGSIVVRVEMEQHEYIHDCIPVYTTEGDRSMLMDPDLVVDLPEYRDKLATILGTTPDIIELMTEYAYVTFTY